MYYTTFLDVRFFGCSSSNSCPFGCICEYFYRSKKIGYDSFGYMGDTVAFLPCQMGCGYQNESNS